MCYDPSPHYLQTKHNNPIHNPCAHSERTLSLDVRCLGEFVLAMDEEFLAVPGDRICLLDWLECLSSQCTISKPHDFRSVGEFCFGFWMSLNPERHLQVAVSVNPPPPLSHYLSHSSVLWSITQPMLPFHVSSGGTRSGFIPNVS